jgi:Zn finger protein HypA/HybF involved in hydrogenase expression
MPNEIPLELVLVENLNYGRCHLKRRLISLGLLNYYCANPECGLTEWLGKPISLQLDHINGVNNDNRLENLRLLCPNCHSQTDTYSGKKSNIRSRNKKNCVLIAAVLSYPGRFVVKVVLQNNILSLK